MIINRILFIFIILFSINSKANSIENNHYKYCNYHDFTYFFLDVYDIYLCFNDKNLLDPKTIYQDNFSIFIKYNMNFTREELSKSSIEEINRYYDISKQDQQKYYQKLFTIFPNVAKKDIIEARYNNAGLTELYHNDNFTGHIKDGKFSKIFLDIWLHQDNKYQNMVKNLFKRNANQ